MDDTSTCWCRVPFCGMNILTRTMLWTMWLLSMRQIVYVAYEHVMWLLSMRQIVYVANEHVKL